MLVYCQASGNDTPVATALCATLLEKLWQWLELKKASCCVKQLRMH